MHFTHKIFLLFFAFCHLALFTYAQFDTTAVASQITRSTEKFGKDIAFVLYKDNKVVYKKELGSFSIKTPQPIGATSQWLTAALVLTFLQEGKISLDDKIASYLPEFSKTFKSYITLRQCLTNFTGIKSEQGVARLLQKNKFKSLEEEVQNFALKRDIETNAGTEFSYSNVGYNIAGRVLEVVSRRSFDRLMQERIIRPLAMRNTTFANEDYNDAVNPSTGAKSTALDLSNFLAMLLNNGSFNNKEILTAESIALLHTIQANDNQIKYAPQQLSGLSYTTGEWVLNSNAQGKAEVVTVPSLQGIWPVVDLCRGYAFVLFTRQSDDLNRDVFLNIKNTIDEQIPCTR